MCGSGKLQKVLARACRLEGRTDADMLLGLILGLQCVPGGM